ncbi:hypothetical protein CUJ84_Chr003624 [Rhizobium leguminosarum]|uniref:Uncharacterized protein n=1 Tax=Rhizobium leguminosarum TaxID=384 RepID=A0A2K9Z6S7_RHILE|nr:hypothetical protein CUJ84_Chr003624 [Rhizobium leguminosarum]
MASTCSLVKRRSLGAPPNARSFWMHCESYGRNGNDIEKAMAYEAHELDCSARHMDGTRP